MQGTYVLGAPEILRPSLTGREALEAVIEGWSAQGFRVLLFGYRPDVVALYKADDRPGLPSDLVPLGLVALADTLRPEARDVLQRFAEGSVQLKIISGDSPETVLALARQAGFPSGLRAVSGADLVGLSPAELAAVGQESSIFGRITPQQNEQLVRVLRDAGHYVAMTGDGVNDVLALKQAQLGIAIESGSQVTRSMADIVLLENSFAALPAALQEGQRIIQGMYDIIRVSLARTLYVALVINGAALAAEPFPVTPKHNAVSALLTVGIPTLGFAVWARPRQPPTRALRAIAHFVVPAAGTIATAALTVYIVYLHTTDSLITARTMVTAVAVLCGIGLLLFVHPPIRVWMDGETVGGDWRPPLLALCMAGLLVAVLLTPPDR